MWSSPGSPWGAGKVIALALLVFVLLVVIVLVLSETLTA